MYNTPGVPRIGVLILPSRHSKCIKVGSTNVSSFSWPTSILISSNVAPPSDLPGESWCSFSFVGSQISSANLISGVVETHSHYVSNS
jgi:hypothetical protein